MTAKDRKAAEKPPWCGHCNEITRMIQRLTHWPDGAITEQPAARCPRCHPLAGEASSSLRDTRQTADWPWGKTPYTHTHCTPENSCVSGGRRPFIPMPAEPGDLSAMSVADIREELILLAEYKPPERMTGYRQTPRFQAALRDLALRQAAQSRARNKGLPAGTG